MSLRAAPCSPQRGGGRLDAVLRAGLAAHEQRCLPCGTPLQSARWDDNEECVICFDPLSADSTSSPWTGTGHYLTQVCTEGHVYHKGCIRSNLRSGNTQCPECDRPILAEIRTMLEAAPAATPAPAPPAPAPPAPAPPAPAPRPQRPGPSAPAPAPAPAPAQGPSRRQRQQQRQANIARLQGALENARAEIRNAEQAYARARQERIEGRRLYGRRMDRPLDPSAAERAVNEALRNVDQAVADARRMHFELANLLGQPAMEGTGPRRTELMENVERLRAEAYVAYQAWQQASNELTRRRDEDRWRRVTQVYLQALNRLANGDGQGVAIRM
jgi:hypothetical protein